MYEDHVLAVLYSVI